MVVQLFVTYASRWLALFGLWLLFVNSIDRREILVGVIASTLTLIMTTPWTRHEKLGFDPKKSWLGLMFKVPGSVASDTLLIFQILAARFARPHTESVFSVAPFATRSDDSARESTRRALATGYVSTSPNSIVVHIERGTRRLLLHELKPVPVPDILHSLER